MASSDYLKLETDMNPANQQRQKSMTQHCTCVNFKYSASMLLFILISSIPFIKLVIDIWIIIIYISSTTTSTSANSSFWDNINMIGTLLCILLLFGTRCYAVFFCGTTDNRSVLMDNNITKNMYRIIPFFGALIAEIIHEKYCFSC